MSLLGKPPPLSVVRLPSDTLSPHIIVSPQCFSIPFNYAHVPGDNCGSVTRRVASSASTIGKDCVGSGSLLMSIHENAASDSHAFGFNSWKGLFILQSNEVFAEHAKRKHTEPKVSWHFLFPVTSSLDGATNAHRKTWTGSFVLCLQGAKRSKSTYYYLSWVSSALGLGSRN